MAYEYKIINRVASVIKTNSCMAYVYKKIYQWFTRVYSVVNKATIALNRNI